MTVSEWADRHRMLSTKASAEPGRWRTHRTPYLKAIMDCLSPISPIERVVFMKGGQVGGTECGNNWIGYVIHHAPGPMMAVAPTVEMAKRNSKQRIDPLIEESPALRELIAPARSRDSGNTILAKEFRGGVLVLTGANSAVGLRSMPVRYLFLDEVDGYPGDVDGEGDAVSLACARTRTFARRKIFIVSTPTIAGASTVEREFGGSDQRRYFAPCPHCGHRQWLRFEQLRWTWGKPETARYVCESCSADIGEHHKTWMLEHGEWRAMAPENVGRTAGFHLSSLYSPVGWRSWRDIAAAPGASGRHGARCGLEAARRDGRRTLDPRSGALLPFARFALDTGFATQEAYAFVRNVKDARIMAVKGVARGATLVGIPTAVDVTVAGKKLRRGVKVFAVASWIAKLELYNNLRKHMEIGEDGTVCYPAGYVHLPKVDAECLKQLCAEQLVTRRDRNGFPVREWQKMRERNEALDGYVYARAAAAAAGLDRFEERHWRELERQLGIRSPMQTEAQAAAGASDPGSPGTSDKRTRPRRLMVGTLKTRAMTIAKGIHYPVGGNAVAVPLRCDADGRVYLADYEPPSANLSVETAVGPLRANATAVSETLDLGSSPRHTLLLARKIGVASNGETIEVQSSPDEAAWTVCPDAAGDTGLAQQQYAIGQAMHVMQARPMDRYVRTSFKNGVTAQTALVLHLTALAGA